MSLENFGYKQELKRALTFWDLLIYGMIFMVPIAPFGVYGYIADASKGMVALAYMIGMAGMIFTALSYARMSEAFPIAGSVYAYAQRGINDKVGFLAGWAILLDYILVPALLYLVSAAALTALIPSIPIWAWLILFILINTVINVFGVEFTAKANKIILILEFIVLGIFIVVGIVALSQGVGNGHLTTKPIFNPGEFNLSLVMGAVSIAVLSFLGFDGISTMSEEVKGGSKVVGKATISALLIVGVLFIVQTWVASDLGAGLSLTNLDTAFYVIAGKAGGAWLKNLTIIATAFSWGIANALAAQAAISRILFSMARDRKLPAILAKVHPKFKTPYISTILVATVSLIVGLIFQSNIGVLTNIVNFGALTGFLVLHVSVINHYMIRQKSKQFVRHLILPLIGFLVIGYVMKGMDITAIKLGVIWVIIGAVYLFIITKVFKASATSLDI
ncbi:APC family permease [Neobacillus cucumis]|uniref:Amino acid permease n=1 Tax=Neobacillus cucumis TaxID=1740721 RepID=A0A2N5HDW5_9BACI|nr:APC family permease [Neobacillus cucumis]PLS03697.1 amino acid permease [Neobacillus cucumis]